MCTSVNRPRVELPTLRSIPHWSPGVPRTHQRTNRNIHSGGHVAVLDASGCGQASTAQGRPTLGLGSSTVCSLLVVATRCSRVVPAWVERSCCDARRWACELRSAWAPGAARAKASEEPARSVEEICKIPCQRPEGRPGQVAMIPGSKRRSSGQSFPMRTAPPVLPFSRASNLPLARPGWFPSNKKMGIDAEPHCGSLASPPTPRSRRRIPPTLADLVPVEQSFAG